MNGPFSFLDALLLQPRTPWPGNLWPTQPLAKAVLHLRMVRVLPSGV